jgi:hypothetical protein
MEDHECRAARQWLSAFRDSEVLDDPVARAHIEACRACETWAWRLDRTTRAVRIRLTGSPDVADAAIEAFRRGVGPSPEHQRDAARFLLAAAGLAGLALFAVSLAGLPGATALAGHFGRDLSGLHAAICVGFLLAAWRPTRYGHSLLPVAAMAAVVVLLPSAAHVTSPDVSPLAEAAHIPLLFGLVGLLLLLEPMRPRRRAHA